MCALPKLIEEPNEEGQDSQFQVQCRSTKNVGYQDMGLPLLMCFLALPQGLPEAVSDVPVTFHPQEGCGMDGCVGNRSD